ncbi:MAG TPA: sulfite exporter TauE/SafE family protein [Ktedonobacterales bacterium]
MHSVTVLQQLLSVVAGGLVGFTLGLIGGGGSILAVPLLLYFVGYHDPHVVLGTTALAVALTAYANLLPHWRAGNIHWKPALAFAIPGALGAVIGASVGKLVGGKQLLFLFALLMIAVAVLMLRQRSDKSGPERAGWDMLRRVIPISLVVGLLAGFFGIGGGFLIVPGLMFATGMPIVAAVGSSLLSVGTFGTATAITYALAGKVSWLIAIEYLAGGILGGWIGAQVSTRMGASPSRKRLLTRIFAGVVVAVALYMLYMNASALHLSLRL